MDVEGRNWNYASMKEKRELRRYRRALLPQGQALCACKDRSGVFALRDISSSGVCLWGCDIAEEGSHVELEVFFPRGRAVRASAIVCHQDKDGSLGLAFDHILDADRALIRGVVTNLLQRGLESTPH